MDNKQSTRIAEGIMMDFARSTGLDPPGEYPRRYLWTDAFAVCNFLELWSSTKKHTYINLAKRLVDQVHSTLGRHRRDGSRHGWISGLDEEEGARHPTAGGLRIGKAMDERREGEPPEEHLEWERDGQYFHYLTKWMHALDRMGAVTMDPDYRRLAVELAKAAHSGFVYSSRHGKLMYWKISIDMSYPLVESMGHHDPLDGLITFNQLQSAIQKDSDSHTGLDLTSEIATMASICEGRDWATDDALGLGGLLSDAYRVGQLIARRSLRNPGLLSTLLDAALTGLRSFSTQRTLLYPAEYRLAFRELGLSIGLHAADRLKDLLELHRDSFRSGRELDAAMAGLMRFVPIGEAIEAFWLDAGNQHSNTWLEHRDINMVMLATSLAPGTYLTI